MGRAIERLVPAGAEVVLPDAKLLGYLHGVTEGRVRFARAYGPSDGEQAVQRIEELRAAVESAEFTLVDLRPPSP